MWLRAVLTVALRGPGKVLLLASAIGWCALAWVLPGGSPPHSALAHGAGNATFWPATLNSYSWGAFTAMWLAMILAMAPPLLLREVGCLWRTSLRRRRHFMVAWFLCGYVGIWVLVGAFLAMPLATVTVTPARIAFAMALVAVWHASPARQRCLNACHRRPTLRVFGAAAQWDALRYGVSTGCYCAAACGLVMLLVVLARDHHLTAMAAAVAVATFERHLPAKRPAWQLPVPRRRAPEWPDMAIAIDTKVAGAR